MALAQTSPTDGDLVPTASAGVWEITIHTTGTHSMTGRPNDQAGLSPLGQLVASVWRELARECPGVVLGDFAVRPGELRALLYVPWESGARTVNGVVASFKAMAAATAKQAGLLLTPTLWEGGFTGRLIQDALELTTSRSTIKARQR